MMSATHKIAALWCAVGVIAGALLVAFVFYPPHSGWAERLDYGDLATWVTAFGTIGAVITALFLARKDSRTRKEESDAKGLVIASYLFMDCHAARGIIQQAISRIEAYPKPLMVNCLGGVCGALKLLQDMSFDLVEKNLEKIAWLPPRHAVALASFPAMKKAIDATLKSAAIINSSVTERDKNRDAALSQLKKMLGLLSGFIDEYSSKFVE